MVSMRDIADRCKVSVATVSKALNHHSDISEETRKRQMRWDIIRTRRRGH